MSKPLPIHLILLPGLDGTGDLFAPLLRRIERLRRLDRGVREMTDLVEILLVVARRRVLDVVNGPQCVSCVAHEALGKLVCH